MVHREIYRERRSGGIRQLKRGRQGWLGVEKDIGSLKSEGNRPETTEEREVRLARCRERCRRVLE